MIRWLLAGALALFTFAYPSIALSPAQVNGCQYLASPPTLSDQQTSVMLCDQNGNLLTTSSGGGGGTSNVNITQTGGVNLPGPGVPVTDVNGNDFGASVVTNTGSTVTGIGSPGDAAWTGTGNCNEIQCAKGLYNLINQNSVTLGTAADSASVPTVSNAWGATGSAVPADAVYQGALQGGNTVGMHTCGSWAHAAVSSATDTQLVAASGSTTIFVCDYSVSWNGTNNLYLEKATTGTCATLTQIDQQYYGQQFVSKQTTKVWYSGVNTGASAQLCVHSGATGAFEIWVNYDQH